MSPHPATASYSPSGVGVLCVGGRWGSHVYTVYFLQGLSVSDNSPMSVATGQMLNVPTVDETATLSIDTQTISPTTGK